MRKIKKDNVYQKELEEGIKNLKIELEAKSAIFKQAQENEEEIKNLKIELDAKTAIYKEQRDSLNKERILNKELQTKLKELQTKYDLLSVQSYTSTEKLQEAEKVITQLEAEATSKETETKNEESEKKADLVNLEKTEAALLTEKLEQFKVALKNEQHSRKNLETRLEDAKEKLSDERENFEKKNLEGKAQIADLLARLQADYPSQAALEADRKTIRDRKSVV